MDRFWMTHDWAWLWRLFFASADLDDIESTPAGVGVDFALFERLIMHGWIR